MLFGAMAPWPDGLSTVLNALNMSIESIGKVIISTWALFKMAAIEFIARRKGVDCSPIIEWNSIE